MKERLFNRQVSACWLEQPLAPLMEIGNNVQVRVHQGEPAYRLVTGEIVKL